MAARARARAGAFCIPTRGRRRPEEDLVNVRVGEGLHRTNPLVHNPVLPRVWRVAGCVGVPAVCLRDFALKHTHTRTQYRVHPSPRLSALQKTDRQLFRDLPPRPPRRSLTPLRLGWSQLNAAYLFSERKEARRLTCVPYLAHR